MEDAGTTGISALARPLQHMRVRSIWGAAGTAALYIVALVIVVTAVVLFLQILMGFDRRFVLLSAIATAALASAAALVWFARHKVPMLTGMARRAETALGLSECFSSALEVHEEGRDNRGPVERGLVRAATTHAAKIDPGRLVPLWDGNTLRSAGAVAVAALVLVSAQYLPSLFKGPADLSELRLAPPVRTLNSGGLQPTGQASGPGTMGSPAGFANLDGLIEGLDALAREAGEGLSEQDLAARLAQIEENYGVDDGGGGWAASSPEQRETMARLDALRASAAQARALAAAEGRSQGADENTAGLGEGAAGENQRQGEGAPDGAPGPGDQAGAGDAMQAARVGEEDAAEAGRQQPAPPVENQNVPFALSDKADADQVIRVDNAVPLTNPEAEGGGAGDASGRGEQALAGNAEHAVDRTRIGEQLTLTGDGQREGNRIRTLGAPPGGADLEELAAVQSLPVGEKPRLDPVQRERVDPQMRLVVARYFAPADLNVQRE